MKFKIDTKAELRVLTLLEQHLSANMAEPLSEIMQTRQPGTPLNIVVNLEFVSGISPVLLDTMAEMQQMINAGGASCIFTQASKTVQKMIKSSDKGAFLHFAPHLAEAVDLVMMEELERDLLADNSDESL
jgi:hypothetical protein